MKNFLCYLLLIGIAIAAFASCSDEPSQKEADIILKSDQNSATNDPDMLDEEEIYQFILGAYNPVWITSAGEIYNVTSGDAQTITLTLNYSRLPVIDDDWKIYKVSQLRPEYIFSHEESLSNSPWNIDKFITNRQKVVDNKISGDWYQLEMAIDSTKPPHLGKYIFSITLAQNDSPKPRILHVSLINQAAWNEHGEFIICQESLFPDEFDMSFIFKNQKFSSKAHFDGFGNYVYSNEEMSSLIRDLNKKDISIQVIDGKTYFYEASSQSKNLKSTRFSNYNNSKNSDETNQNAELAFQYNYTAACDLMPTAYTMNPSPLLTLNINNEKYTEDILSIPKLDLPSDIMSIRMTNGNAKDMDTKRTSVLVVWNGVNFNHDYLSRNNSNRMSIVLTGINTSKTIDLSKVPMIGTNRSWANAIGSLSFHFGNSDSLLPDY